MSGMLRKGMSWLGLGPDEDYADYDFVDEQLSYDDDQGISQPSAGAARPGTPSVRPQPANRPMVMAEDWDEPAEPGGIRVLPAVPAGSAGEPRSGRGVVRPLPTASSVRPQVVAPSAFNDAQEVGDLVKRRQPVILNLQGLDADLARRLLDFASGVAYGLGGRVEKAMSRVYVVTPADVEISAEDRRRIKEGSLT